MTDLHNNERGFWVPVSEQDVQETGCSFLITIYNALKNGETDPDKLRCYACLAFLKIEDGQVYYQGKCMSWNRGGLPRK